MNSDNKKTHWRSLQDLREGDTVRPELHREFVSDDASTLEAPITRRTFLGAAMGTAALAGLSGCVRKDIEKILPYAERPEDLIPGRPRFFRTAMSIGGNVLGLHVESQEGRPTKVEGNPDHPMSTGAAHTWAQASVLNLYDPDRSTGPLHKGAAVTWDELSAALEAAMAGFAGQGAGLAVLTDYVPSATLARLEAKLEATYPGAKVYVHDNAFDLNRAYGMGMVGKPGFTVAHDLAKAKVIACIDADVFGTDGDVVKNTRGFAAGRQVFNKSEVGAMNRVYVAEAGFSITGTMADNRLRVPASHLGEVLRGIAGEILGSDNQFPGDLRSETTQRDTKQPGDLAWDGKLKAFVKAMAADLLANKGASAVMVGPRMPAWAHALAAAVNQSLGNTGSTVTYHKGPRAQVPQTLWQLAERIRSAQVHTLVISGSNPAYDGPADLGFGELLKTVQVSIHHGTHVDETGALCTYHIPASHYLESWGDRVAADGTVSVVQPLIAPLYDTWSKVEFYGKLTGDKLPSGYNHVQATLATKGEAAWKRDIHGGVVTSGAVTFPADSAFNWSVVGGEMRKDLGPQRPTASALEVNYVLDQAVLDGRYANNGWLQELPNTISKLTWDNAVLMNQKTAAAAGVANGDMVKVALSGLSADGPAWIVPGIADNVIILPLGYGRTAGGAVANTAGFDFYKVRTAAAPHTAQGATLTKAGGTYPLVSTQEYGYLTEPYTGRKRNMVRETSVAGFVADEHFVIRDEMKPFVKGNALDKTKLVSLWTEPNKRDGQQWGLTIDLNTCTGCNACTIACQAENNIPVVGKERVADGREMHWIRIDRYFTGDDENNPEAVVQPVACMHCETAPCENVCPVAATAHSPEGLNDMAYNRCIGTRYCANNCPFKVRRFNFFNFQSENEEAAPLYGMQKNPDVSVRFRGVMEKCTYCIQRITQKKIEAKRDGNGVVPDTGSGAVVTACQQTCPAGAIVFGDINNKESAVAKLKATPRNYVMLAELNIHPRTSYLGRLRNPNEMLVKKNG